MSRKIVVLISLFLLMSAASFAETEFWSANTVQVPIKEKIKLNVIPELRFRDSSGGLYYFQTYLGPAIALNKNLEIDAFYALKYGKSGSSWSTSNLWYLDCVLRDELFSFLMSNRNRIEYDVTPDTLKLRELFQAKKNGWLAGEELFYNFKKGLLDEGRTSVAYSFALWKGTELSAGYLLRMQRQNPAADWTWTNVLTAGIKAVL